MEKTHESLKEVNTMAIKVSWMKSKLWIIVLVLIIQPPNGLPNFGFSDPVRAKDLPTPVKNSAFTANLAILNDCPELVYVSEDNRIIVIDTADLKILYTVEIKGNIKKALVEDLENDGTPELIILSDSEIAVYSNNGKPKWDKDLDSLGVDMDLLKDISEEIYHVVIAEKDLVQAFSSLGNLLWSRETNENYKIITADVDQKFSEEVILVHENSISALSHNGSLIWKSSFNKSISAVCEFSPPNSILVSLKDGNFYFVDGLGRNSRIKNARMNTAILVPWRSSMEAYLSGFFAVSPYGHLRAYHYTGDAVGDLTEFRKTTNIISCDLDNRDAKSCEIDSYIRNMEEHVIISEEGEVSVLIYCSKKVEEQQYENYWELLPLSIDDKGDKIKRIDTGMKNISLSLVFRAYDARFLLLMTHTGTLCRYEIFSNANLFLKDFDRAEYELKKEEDFTEAYRLLKDLDMELARYYVLEGDIEEYVNLCTEKMKEEEDLARESLREGLEKKGDELREALQDLSEAYSKSRKADLADSDILHEIDGKTYTVLDLKEDIVFLCLDFVKNADKAFKEERYEDALRDFSFIRGYWIDFSGYMWLFSDSKEYKEGYSEIGDTYNRWKIEDKIRVCIEKIMDDAEELRKKGRFDEAKRKYNFIIDSLREADWEFESDIIGLESRKSEIEAYIIQKREQRSQLIGIVLPILFSIIAFFVILKFKIEKKLIMIIILVLSIVIFAMVTNKIAILEEFFIDILKALLIASILSILGTYILKSNDH